MSQQSFTLGMSHLDIPRILEIENASFNCPWTKAMFSDAVEEAQGTLVCLARTQGGDIIGYCIGQIVLDEVSIHRIVVEEGYRRQQAGRRLLQLLILESTERGAQAANLEVNENNLAARRLYETLGFSCIARRPGYYTQPPGSALIYCRAFRHQKRTGLERLSKARSRADSHTY